MKPSKTLRAVNQLDCLSDRDRDLLIRARCVAIEWARSHGDHVHAGVVSRIAKGFHSIEVPKQGQIFKGLKTVFEKTDATTTNNYGKSKGHLVRIWKIKNWNAANEYLREANLELPMINL